MRPTQIKLKWKLASLFLVIAGISVAFPRLRSTAVSLAGNKAAQTKDAPPQSKPSALVHSQPESPLRVTLLEFEASNPLRPVAKLMVTNMSEKPVQAYALRYDSVTTSAKSSGVILTNAASTGSLLQPGLSETTGISDIEYSESLKKLVISVDYVEFEDGTNWGADTYKSGQRLAGNRAGAQAALNQLSEMLKKHGSQYVVDNIDKLEILPPLGQPDEWVRGFKTGLNSIRERIRQSYKWEGLHSIQEKIQQPFDATGFKAKKGGK